MKLKNYSILFIIGLFFVPKAIAQNYDSLAAVYVAKYKDIAVEEMERVNIPASITLAQGILETGFGLSDLMKNTNNHFGIKCHENWTGKTFSYTDDAPDECFRVYDNPEQSFRDHSDFLRNRPRYAKLFTLDPKDYKAWAYGLKEAGYATNPKYPDLLIKYIETYQLYKYDNPDYIEEEWTADENVNIQGEIFIDKNPNKQADKDDDVKIDANIKYPQQAPTFKTGPKKIYTVNKRKAVKMGIGEDLEVISLKTDVEEADLRTYNELLPGQVVAPGQYIFLEKKRKKGAEKTCKVKTDDNMWLISQHKGVLLEKLLKRNFLVRGEEPTKGETVYLKGKAPNKPKLRPKIEETPKPDLLTKNPVKANDTIYPNLPQTDKTSADSSAVIQWEDGKKLYEKTPVKPYKMKDSVVLFDLGDWNALATNQASANDLPMVVTEPVVPGKSAVKHTVVKGDTMYNISKRYNVSAEEIKKWNNLPDNNIRLGQVLLINP